MGFNRVLKVKCFHPTLKYYIGGGEGFAVVLNLETNEMLVFESKVNFSVTKIEVFPPSFKNQIFSVKCHMGESSYFTFTVLQKAS